MASLLDDVFASSWQSDEYCGVLDIQNVNDYLVSHAHGIKLKTLFPSSTDRLPFRSTWMKWKGVVDGITLELGALVEESAGEIGLSIFVRNLQGIVALPFCLFEMRDFDPLHREVEDQVPMKYDTEIFHPVCDLRKGAIIKLAPKYQDVIFGAYKNELIMVVLFAIKLYNCRNVDVSIVQEYDDKLVKKRAKIGRPYVKRIYSLQIGPISIGNRHLGGTSGSKSFHVCRGHFKTFTDDKPLFGRVVGTFWWPAQVRGSKRLGEVEKEYKL